MGVAAVRVPTHVFYRAAEGRGTSRERERAAADGGAARRGVRGTCGAEGRARAEELLEELRAVALGLLINVAAEARLGPCVNVSLPEEYASRWWRR